MMPMNRFHKMTKSGFIYSQGGRAVKRKEAEFVGRGCITDVSGEAGPFIAKGLATEGIWRAPEVAH